MRNKRKENIDQISLLAVIMRMSVGQCLCLSRDDMLRAAEGSIVSPLFDGPARNVDIDSFVLRIKENWGLGVTHNKLEDKWTLYKIK